MSLPGTLLEIARAVLDHPQAKMEGAWPRAAALLGRQSLEEGLDRFWDRTLPPLRKANRKTQLACLDLYVRDHDLAMAVRTAWSALSRACHHHVYELSPTAPELDAWLKMVERLVSGLDQADAAG